MKFYETLEKQLKKEPNYVTDSGELKKWVIINKAQNYDAELIGLLLDDKELKVKFFLNIKGVLVFNQSLFVQFMEQKNYLNDSYTAYKNKVGLNIDGKYLKQRNEVALVWPFKDCVLEGGQSREEDNREEIFFNETLAQDEITQLLEPKVFTNISHYTDKANKTLSKFNRNEIGTITDNLIIKGNNLLALSSLEKEFKSKVKLIYIDPPYNTGKDGFGYNDCFNHSAWLTFMKNRLVAARNLLQDDGSIWISLDINESHYCKVLCDEIFGRENFIADLIWHHTIQAKNDTKGISLHHNSTLVYRKTSSFDLNKIERTEENNINYKNPDNDINGKWRSGDVRSPSYAKSLIYKIKTPNGNTIEPPEFGWRWNKDTLNDKINSGEIIFNKEQTKIIRKIYLAEQGGRVVESIWFAKDVGTSREGTNEIKQLFGDKIFATPKPEKLLHRIINIASEEGDIVLDYHLGSGTTAAVAHKMGRQYIGIEQMDYVETVAVKRIEKVIKGEQGGISVLMNWKGGGKFVYLELKKYNQIFIEQIESATDSKAVLKIWEGMKAKSYLNYNVDLQKQDQHIEEFKTLPLEEQKQHLVELLDKNQLYVNLSSLNDKDFCVTAEEKKVTQDFYHSI